ncbi:MAG TPA: hypothetical protein VMX14_07725 [Anaerolineae bacterium]|nr:hypothetical protein [Anaerolineae bacterium]
MFLRDQAATAQYTLDLLREATPGGRFILGVTEDIPKDAWKRGLRGIAEGFFKCYMSGPNG